MLSVLVTICLVVGAASDMDPFVPDQMASPSASSHNYQMVVPAPGLLNSQSKAVSAVVAGPQAGLQGSSIVFGRPVQGLLMLKPTGHQLTSQNYVPAQTSPVSIPSGGSIALATLPSSNIAASLGLYNPPNNQSSSGNLVNTRGAEFFRHNNIAVGQSVPNHNNLILSLVMNKQFVPPGGQVSAVVKEGMLNSPSEMYRQPGLMTEGQLPNQLGGAGSDQKASGSDQQASGSKEFTLDDFTPPEPQHIKVFDDDDGGDKYIDDEEDQPEPEVLELRLPVAQPVPVPVPYKVAVPVPHPYPVPVHVVERYEVPVEKVVEEMVEKKVPVLVEKLVPYPVVKHLPIKVEKLVPVPQPYPYPVTVHVVKYVHHYSKKHGHKGKGR